MSFFKPAWAGKNKKRAIKPVLTDHNVLAKNAGSDDNYKYEREETIVTPVYTGASCACQYGSGYGCTGDPTTCVANYPVD